MIRPAFSSLLSALALLAPTTLPAQTIDAFEFEARSLGGRMLRSADYADHVLIVDIWGTWCPPCRKAVPVLQRLYAKYKQHGLEIIGFNFERVPAEQAPGKVRDFAVEQGITYELTVDGGGIREQVPGFRAFPTMLLFRRGMKHEETRVGFGPQEEAELEAWIRKALGLDADAAGEPAAGEAVRKPVDPLQEKAPELPPGVVFKPGEHDRGFDFEVEDVTGKALHFADLDAPVLLALTSSWDTSAADTAKLLAQLHADWKDKGVHVLAAHFERVRGREAQLDAIRAFQGEHGLEYRAFPIGLDFTRKIHAFSGLPLFLVFDAEGVLVLRQGPADPATLRENLAAALKKNGG